jgi:hypothetical protein
MTSMNLFVKATTSNSVVKYQAFTINIDVSICNSDSLTSTSIDALTITTNTGTIKSSKTMDEIFTASSPCDIPTYEIRSSDSDGALSTE